MFSWIRGLFGGRRRGRDSDDVGGEGERIAADWLVREKGMLIVARNWRAPCDNRLELDLIATDGTVLVFVEVKSRPAHALVPGYFAATTKRKKRALLGAVRAYLAGLRTRPKTVRYDVIEVVRHVGRTGAGDGGFSPACEVRHYENVPLFSKAFLRGG